MVDVTSGNLLADTMPRVMRDIYDNGRRAYGPGGQLWLPRLQILHVLNSLGRARFDDNRRARLRQHVFLGGSRGTRKTSIISYFLEDLAGAKNLNFTRDEDMDESGNYPFPVFLLLGSGVTWERICGSVTNEGELIPPLLPQVDYAVAGELLDWLGHRDDERKETMEAMNVAMEEGVVSRMLVKFGNIRNAQEAKDELAKYGVSFNKRNRTMSFHVRTSFISASRFLSEKEMKVLDDSGFMDRQEKAEWMPSKDAYRAAWWEGPGAEPTTERRIRAFNDKLWGIRWGNIPYPDKEKFLRPVMKKYHDFYIVLEEQMGAAPKFIRSFRDWNSGAQLLAAFAVMRTVESATEKPRYIDSLQYTEDDVRNACSFLDSYFAPVYDQWTDKVELDPRKEADWSNLVGFYVEHGSTIFHGPELVNWYCSNVHTSPDRTASTRTGYKFLSRCRERGWVQSDHYAEYALREDVIEAGGAHAGRSKSEKKAEVAHAV